VVVPARVGSRRNLQTQLPLEKEDGGIYLPMRCHCYYGNTTDMGVDACTNLSAVPIHPPYN